MMRQLLPIVISLLFITSCATSPSPQTNVDNTAQTTKKQTRYRVPYDNNEKQPQTELEAVKSPTRAKIQKLLRSIIGSKGSINVDGRTYVADCSGMVKAIYDAVGIDVMAQSRKFPQATGGVDIIYQSFENQKWQDANKTPQAGDLIFFNNTWDQNKNKKWDDALTHVAIVEGVEVGSNTISFIHSVHAGIRRYRLNLDYPKSYMHKKRKMNDFLRRRPKHDQDRTKYMSSNLFWCYIDVLVSHEEKMLSSQ